MYNKSMPVRLHACIACECLDLAFDTVFNLLLFPSLNILHITMLCIQCIYVVRPPFGYEKDSFGKSHIYQGKVQVAPTCV